MIIETVSVAAVVAIMAASAAFWYKKGNKNVDKISFREAFDLVGLPIITFYKGNNKLNFILDTGSSISIIDAAVAKSLNIEHNGKDSMTRGLQGEISYMKECNIDIYYREICFNADLSINDMTSLLQDIKMSTGVTIHGLLGSDFFDKYKYVIDFNQYVAYSKK